MDADVSRLRKALAERTAKTQTLIRENTRKIEEESKAGRINEGRQILESTLKLILAENEWLQESNELLLDAYEASCRLIKGYESRTDSNTALQQSVGEVLKRGVHPATHQVLSNLGLIPKSDR